MTTERSKQTIGLCMIVRDEAEVIGRCIESVRPLIDSWTICDTGSTDGTPELVRKLLHGIPGTLHRRPWRSFGANRSELLTLAAGSADYLLLLDADMTLEHHGSLPYLSADAYSLRHLGSLDYAAPRIVRGDRHWWFERSTHEFLAAEGGYSEEVLADALINHHADGGNRANRLERDARLLKADLEWNPDDPRATFYLAQTYRDSGDIDRAIGLFRRRVELDGWDEETFYAAYQLGVLAAERDALGGMRLLIDAAARRPVRAEPLHELARLCRLQGWHEAAYAFATQGLEIPYPADRLFVHRDVYEWGLLFELSIAAYWIGRIDEALRTTDLLLARGVLPAEYELAARQNRGYCLDGAPDRLGPERRISTPAGRLDDLCETLELGELRLAIESPCAVDNPTIAAEGDGFRMIVETGGLATHLIRLDHSLGAAEVVAILDESERIATPDGKRGHCGLRLFDADGRWYALGMNAFQTQGNELERVLLTLDDSRITTVDPLRSPRADGSEQSWMPFVIADQIHIVSSIAPTIVLRFDRTTRALTHLSEQGAPDWALPLRGGAQGLEVAGGHLFVVHETLLWPTSGELWMHRLIRLDDHLRLTSASPRFTFTGADRERCSGLARRGADLVLSFGLGDAAGVALVSEKEALSLLRPVE